MTYIITSLCLRDGSCVGVCPVDCIVPGKPKDEWPWFYIDPDTCIDCGACVPECPVAAIFEESDTPEKWKDYIAKNADVFKDNTNLPKAPTREKWEHERAQEGTPASLYYRKYPPKA